MSRKHLTTGQQVATPTEQVTEEQVTAPTETQQDTQQAPTQVPEQPQQEASVEQTTQEPDTAPKLNQVDQEANQPPVAPVPAPIVLPDDTCGNKPLFSLANAHRELAYRTEIALHATPTVVNHRMAVRKAIQAEIDFQAGLKGVAIPVLGVDYEIHSPGANPKWTRDADNHYLLRVYKGGKDGQPWFGHQLQGGDMPFSKFWEAMLKRQTFLAQAQSPKSAQTVPVQTSPVVQTVTTTPQDGELVAKSEGQAQEIQELQTQLDALEQPKAEVTAA